MSRLRQIASSRYAVAVAAILLCLLLAVSSFILQDKLPAITFAHDAPASYQHVPVAYIAGAVHQPGVYPVSEDTRLYELVEEAGGIVADADLQQINESINLAQVIEDGEHVLIPFFSQPETNLSAPMSSAGGTSGLSQINLNQASQSELESLPGIGAVTAQNIVAARPFASIDQLLDVPGIGQAKYDQIKQLVGI